MKYVIEEKDLLLIENKYNNIMINKDKIKKDEKLLFEELMDYLIYFYFNGKSFFRKTSTFYKDIEDKLNEYKDTLIELSNENNDDLIIMYLGNLIKGNEVNQYEIFLDMEKNFKNYERKDFVVSISYIKTLLLYLNILTDEDLMSSLGALTVHPYNFNKKLIKEFSKNNNFFNELNGDEKYYTSKMSTIFLDTDNVDDYYEYIEPSDDIGSNFTRFFFSEDTFSDFINEFVNLDNKYSNGLILNLMMNGNIHNIIDHTRGRNEFTFLDTEIIEDNLIENHKDHKNNHLFNTLVKIENLYDFNLSNNFYLRLFRNDKEYKFNNFLEAIKYYIMNVYKVSNLYDTPYIRSNNFTFNMLYEIFEYEKENKKISNNLYFGPLFNKVEEDKRERMFLSCC